MAGGVWAEKWRSFTASPEDWRLRQGYGRIAPGDLVVGVLCLGNGVYGKAYNARWVWPERIAFWVLEHIPNAASPLRPFWAMQCSQALVGSDCCIMVVVFVPYISYISAVLRCCLVVCML
jgi:hypothetical protein